MTRSLRPGKVFVDWSQNAARKTTAAPYTVRARSVPAVSTPVTWDEVAGCGRAEQLVFRPDDVGPRVQDFGDLLAPLFERRRATELP
jgi:bifunctional non-homologous end joining protein LigD